MESTTYADGTMSHEPVNNIDNIENTCFLCIPFHKEVSRLQFHVVKGPNPNFLAPHYSKKRRSFRTNGQFINKINDLQQSISNLKPKKFVDCLHVNLDRSRGNLTLSPMIMENSGQLDARPGPGETGWASLLGFIQLLTNL